VAINGAANAGLLAVQILALQDETLQRALLEYREKMAAEVRAKDQRLQELGAKRYLQEKEG
jgi:5-(carboxyamino)imidazole ribonucleotide mutase